MVLSMRSIVPLLAAAILLPAADLSAQDAPSVKEITDHLRYKDSQIQRLMRGEIVSNDMEETLDKQMGVTLAMLIRAPFAHVADSARLGRYFDQSLDIVKIWPLGSEPTLDDFAAIGFDGSEIAEVKKLVGAKPGSGFNLSAGEFERLSGLKRYLEGRSGQGAGMLESVNDAYRAILFGRLQAYQAGGLGAIEPYTRGGRKTASPSDELTLAIAREAFLSRRMPDLFLTFINYPKHTGVTVEHDYFCLKQKVEGRPCFVLIHRMYTETPEYLLGMERQFFVGHTYNSLQKVAGAFKSDDDTIVIHTSRTSTDQVAGFGSGLKKGIGRGRVKEAVTAYLLRIREELERTKP